MGLCSRAIWLDHGTMLADGSADEIVRNYLNKSGEVGDTHISLAERDDRGGDGALRFTGFHVRGLDGNPIEYVVAGDDVEFVFSYTALAEKVQNVSVWFWIMDGFGRRLMCLWSRLTGEDFERLPSEGELVCSVPRFPLVPGRYTVDLITALVNGTKSDAVPHAAMFEVVGGDYFGTGRPVDGIGDFMCEHSWSLSESFSKHEVVESAVS